MSLNKAVVSATVLEAPEERFTNNNDPVSRFMVETGENVKLKLICWGALSEACKSLKIGDVVLASGTLQINSFKNQAGVTKKDFELSVRDLFLAPGGFENLNPNVGQAPTGQRSQPRNNPKPQSSSQSKEEDLSDVLMEDEIPF
jgi:single-stranded DNA-binding protein